jgi:hypothetical protein
MIGTGQHLEGFEAPIHGSLGSPILLGGAPRGLAIVNGTLAAAVGLGLQQWIAGHRTLGGRPQHRRLRRAPRPGFRARYDPSSTPERLFRVLNLAEYRHRPDRLADHLPWAALVAPGVILNKDGSFQRTVRFRGPDLESATEGELISACARANNVLRRFGTGWALFFEAERREASAYPDSDFPDAASWLVDQERRAAFEAKASTMRAATI